MLTKRSLPTHAGFQAALRRAQSSDNGGLGNHMWGTLVDREGVVVAVAFTGDEVGDQWPGSRLISAEKANTANGLALDTMALSTANLYAGTQPGGPLFGIALSNPVNVAAAYGGQPAHYGTPMDHLVGKPVGGVVVFGGGLALYSEDGHVIGGLGVSGDLSCADHNIAWKVRHELEFDYVPAGVDPKSLLGKPKDDNIVYDIDEQTGKSASGWGHPSCSPSTKAVGEALPTTHPIRSRG